MGGASYGDGDASLAAFRTRAADNFIYLVVAFRGGGSMIIGPKGQILAQAEDGDDCIVAADVDLRRRLGEQAAQRARAYGSKPMVQKLSALYTRLAGTPEPGSKAVVA